MASINFRVAPFVGAPYSVRSGAHIDTEANAPSAAPTGRADDAKWAPVRKAKPATVLLPATRRWLDTLAPDLKPEALVTKFPRLANHIAADWANPDACRSFICGLLADDRGNRQGFPKDVAQDILALWALYVELHPASEVMSAY